MCLHNVKYRKDGGVVNILDELLKECLLHAIIRFLFQLSKLFYSFVPLVNEGFFLHFKLVIKPEGSKIVPIIGGTYFL